MVTYRAPLPSIRKNIIAKTKVFKYPTSMNNTEREYAIHLDLLLRAGKIQRWDYEPEKLRLAPATYYSPDFRVINQEGEIEMHEVKGFWRDDARVKIKVAAEFHPYKFYAVKKKKKGEWEYESF